MFCFHPVIQANYTEVQEWLSKREKLPNYRQNSAWNKLKRQLTDPTFESAALQFYVLFPAHSSKVGFTLQHVIGQDSMVEWLQHKNQITAIDVGCGAGAASIAFMDCLLKLKDQGHIQQPLHVHFIGIDPNRYAIAIYYQQLERLKLKVDEYNFDVTYKLIAESDLRAVNELREELTKQKENWGIPFLTHVFLFQANVISPFSTRYNETEFSRQELAALGVPTQALSNSQEVFGKEEATAYKQILENAGIDNLHIVTVGTEGYEQRVSELALAIDNEFEGNNHIVKRADGGEFSTTYRIPETCYWREYKNNTEWPLNFCTEVSSISNVALADHDWQEIQSVQNLQIAWARARHHLFSQTLVDEVEIRLFESRLDANLFRLQRQLIAYAKDVVHTDGRLHFKFPKSDTKLRPLGLSRIEEEIISTALIQKLGQRISGIVSRSYAYKFSRTYGEHSTEYLYENWFDAYSRYIKDARNAAYNNEGCVVLQIDIKSFYTRIIQDTLVQFSSEQLSRSARVEWLLRVLFAREIDEHEAGKGIVQGNLASGFFANLYLVDLDARFGPGNEWGVEFFRYVDDMILVVPDPDLIQNILNELEQELEKIGLELNRDKTESFTDVTDFIRSTDQDETLDKLQTQFQATFNCLWILGSEHRQIFRKAYTESQAEWWYRVELYCICLKRIGIHIDIALLSRRIYKYLFNDRLCERDYDWQETFQLPLFPDSSEEEQIYAWKTAFEDSNEVWMEQVRQLAHSFEELLIESKENLAKITEKDNAQFEKRWIRTLRFCVNKLVQLEFPSKKSVSIILDTLLTSPWLIRNPHKLIENLAVRGYTDHIRSLLTRYSDETDQMNEYMKSITVRAIRFLKEVPESIWEEVVASAVSPSVVTSLMATETWLKISQDSHELIKDAHIQIIEEALNREPQPILRLKKNYMLILGEHKRAPFLIEEDKQDILIQNVQDIIQDDAIDSLFDYYEPEILTREFYSGYRIDDGFYHPSAP